MTEKPGLAVWWRATRPFSFPASFIPAVFGPVVAWSLDPALKIKWIPAILAALGSVILHGGANIFNDYFDFKKGVDREGTFGSSGVLTQKLVTPQALFRAGIVCYAAGALIGLYLWHLSGNCVLWLGLTGAAIGYFYTTGVALKYKALGALCVFLVFGIMITLGAYCVQTSHVSWTPALFAIPFGLLIDGILHGNNMRDILDDSVVEVTTLAGHLGVKGSQ
jgi:1,4-dihydroxy-2-naphthoate polyprenyltransferase